MKQITPRVRTSFSFGRFSCLLLLLLLTVALAAAQQEVDPDHFDTRPDTSTAQSRTPGAHHKRARVARKPRSRKAVTATAKSESQKAGQATQGTQPIAR